MTTINNIEQNPIIKIIKLFFVEHNEKAYIVGGFIRDCMLSTYSADIDIVVQNGHACKIAKNLANYINGYLVELDEINNIYRVIFPDKVNYIDIADCVGETIQEDLQRRDFTINALAYDLTDNQIIDVCNGISDLKNKVIRELSEENLVDDPIRIFRAFRFKSTLGFNFAESLNLLLKKHAPKLKVTAKERINTELMKLFGGQNIIETIKSLNEFNLIELIFPEFIEIKKIPPNTHHHLPLFEHLIETVKQVQIYYESASQEVKEHLDTVILGGYKRIAYLKLAAFLHDVGKPATWKIEPETGRHRFIMHDTEGAKIIAPTLKELKFSKKQINYIQKIIKNHIYPASIVTSAEKNEKSFLRFIRKMEDEVIDLIVLAHADRMSALGEDITQEMINLNINGLKELLEFYFQEKNKLAPLPKLLDGEEIMEILNIKPSRQLGIIIEKLKEAQLSSEIITKEEAIEFVKKCL